MSENQFWQAQLQQFAPYQERLWQVYNGAANSLSSFINRMGAEPAYQLKHVVWLPMGIAANVRCQVWKDLVHKDAFPAYGDEIDAWNRLARNALAVICLDHVVFACQKPSLMAIDDAGRLHNPEGPALGFADGFSAHAWHGVIVEPRIIEEPESISIEEIELTQNAEIRRVLIERFGQARYLQESGAVEVQKDEFGTLYRKEIQGDEALVMVKVVNSSPEPDGSFRDYFLRVPPDLASAKQAVAWTFGFDEEEYSLLAES